MKEQIPEEAVEVIAQGVETETALRRFDERHPAQVPVAQDNGPSNMLMAAIQGKLDPSIIEKLMDLRDREETGAARKAFYQAVASFKEHPPEVLKDKENSQFSKGEKKAMYVSLGNLVKTVNPALGKHGLSASWEINQTDKLVKVSCRLSHRLGHSETVTMEAPPDTSGGNSKNPIQQIKSTVTYLRAATFEAVTGIAATDDAILDDDGNAVGSEFITEDQRIQIEKIIVEKGVDAEKFLAYMGVEDTETIMAPDFNRAMMALKKAKGKAA